MNVLDASVLLRTSQVRTHLIRVPKKLKAKIELRPLRKERRNWSMKVLASVWLQSRSEGILSVTGGLKETKGSAWLCRGHSDPELVVPRRLRLPPVRGRNMPRAKEKHSPLKPWSNDTSGR